MADDSVGKISLGLEITEADLEKQIQTLADGMQDALQGSLDAFSKTLDGFLKDTSARLNSTIQEAVNIKIPKIDAMPTAPVTPVASTDALSTAPNVPGKAPVITPKINLEPARNQTEKLNTFVKQSLQSTMGGFGNMASFMKRTFEHAGASIKNFAQVGTSGSSAVSQSAEEIRAKIESLAAQMDNASSRAEFYRHKLEDLRTSYEGLSARGKEGTIGQKLSEDMLKAEGAMQRYGDRSDKLRLDIEKLEGAMQQVGVTSKVTGDSVEKTGGRAGKTGKSFERAGKQVNNFATGIQRTLTRVLRQVFVFAVLYKAIHGLVDYMNSALKTNQQFTHSLNQIKTNLAVAFQPIYQAILPAINALMKALATATAYIAAFFSALGGKSYQQSYQAAKSLEAAKKSMEGYGEAAKDAQGALMGFDEINQLDLQDQDASGADGGFEMTPPDVVPDVEESAGKFKDIFSDLLAPFKAAWENEGQNTINSMRHALDGIKALFGEIGKSFKEVWTGGTGQAILESFLRILQQVFGLVGDIGHTFANAWAEGGRGTAVVESIGHAILGLLAPIEQIGISMREVWEVVGYAVAVTFLNILKNIFTLIGDIGFTFANVWVEGGRGTAIVQGIANVFLHLLELVERISDSLVRVWGEVGPTVVRTFLDIIQATVGVLESLAEKLLWVWDHGGQHLFESLIRLGAKIFELAGYIYVNFVAPFVNWFLDMIAPALAVVVDGAGYLLDAFVGLIDWLMGSGEPVLKTFLALFTAWKAAVFIVEMGKATVAIIANTAAKTKDIIETGILHALYAKDAILKGASTVATVAMTVATTAWNVVAGIAAAVTTAFGAAVAFLTSPIALVILAIGAIIAIVLLLIKHWDEVKEAAFKCWAEIVVFFTQAIPDWWNNTVAPWFTVERWKELFANIWTSIKEIWKNLVEWWSNTAIVHWWNDNVAPWFTLARWTELFKNIWTSLQGVWTSLVNWWNNTAIVGWWNNDIAPWFTLKRWKELFGNIKTAFEEIWESIKITAKDIGIAIAEAVSGTIRNVVNAVLTLIQNKVNDFIGLLNRARTTINILPGVDIPEIRDIKLPRLARGTIVDQPTLAMLGERGKKEVVMPLEDTGFVNAIGSAVGTAVLQAMQFAGGGMGGSNVQEDRELAVYLDGTKVARVILPKMNKEAQRMGYQGVLVPV